VNGLNIAKWQAVIGRFTENIPATRLGSSSMQLRNVILSAVFVTGLTGMALAQDADAIKNRINVMKVTVSGAVRTGFLMTTGKQDFNAAEAKKAMETVATAIATFPSLFPPGSENIQDRASPEIWKNMDDFKARAAKLGADATAAAAAADKGLDAFKAAFNTMGENCGGCHSKYRLEE
jgi:cytochrome c556